MCTIFFKVYLCNKYSSLEWLNKLHDNKFGLSVGLKFTHIHLPTNMMFDVLFPGRCSPWFAPPLSQYQGHLAISGIIFEYHFWNWGGLLILRGQGCCQTSYNAQDSHSNKYSFQMSVMPKLGNIRFFYSRITPKSHIKKVR